MLGATKQGEYSRTIEMISKILGDKNTKEEVIALLYFLGDSQYNASELIEMANKMNNSLKEPENGVHKH